MDVVRARLDTIPALSGRVHGAARLAQITQAGGAQLQANVAAFVLPVGMRGGSATAATGMFVQTIDRLVGVVLMVRNLGDGTGEKAGQELEPLETAVIEAIAGWAPDSAIGVFTLARSELVSISAGTITHQIDFALEDQLRIAR